MMEHRGTSFFHSCVKVPVDPYSRQPTPSYERPRLSKDRRTDRSEKEKRINFAEGKGPIMETSESSSSHDILENFLEFLESIPDYGQVHHLSNEQFKQKVEYLKRKQRLFLKNLRNSSDSPTREKSSSRLSTMRDDNDSSKLNNKSDADELKLNGKKCYLEESRTASPILFSSSYFAGLADNQDLLTYRYRNKDKEMKTIRNKEIYSTNKNWNTLSESKSNGSIDSDGEDSAETKSLPPNSSREWHPTVPKPFNFIRRKEAENYITRMEMEKPECVNQDNEKKNFPKKRRVRPIPITSKIPLYDKLMAEREERSRIVREKSARDLLSQVRPFKLECDRRAWRSLARSSPELYSKSDKQSSRFKAKPVPKNLFGTEVYDRMLEDEYYRQLKKKLRAAELMNSSSLPPSMARRERIKSAHAHLHDMSSRDDIVAVNDLRGNNETFRITPMTSNRTTSTMTVLSSQGNNLASILRCQASREKLERDIREQMEKKRHEQMLKMRESLIGLKPAWKALRSAARHEHNRDLGIRTALRRNEAREQAERHRLQMEIMHDRVTQIPTLFERHSQNFQSLGIQQETCSKNNYKTKRKKLKKPTSSSIESYLSFASNSRPNSGSLISSSGTFISSINQSNQSLKSSSSSDNSTAKLDISVSKKKNDRKPLKVSIKETAELIEDHNQEKSSTEDLSCNEEHDDALTSNNNIAEE